MEERRCMLCGELLKTDRGKICWNCVRKHQQRKQQRQYFGMKAELPKHRIKMNVDKAINLLSDYIEWSRRNDLAGSGFEDAIETLLSIVEGNNNESDKDGEGNTKATQRG